MVELVETNGQDSGKTAAAMNENSSTAAAAAAPTEEVPDREMPLSFVSERHLDTIEGINCITQTWRMKERVREGGGVWGDMFF